MQPKRAVCTPCEWAASLRSVYLCWVSAIFRCPRCRIRAACGKLASCDFPLLDLHKDFVLIRSLRTRLTRVGTRIDFNRRVLHLASTRVQVVASRSGNQVVHTTHVRVHCVHQLRARSCLVDREALLQSREKVTQVLALSHVPRVPNQSTRVQLLNR